MSTIGWDSTPKVGLPDRHARVIGLTKPTKVVAQPCDRCGGYGGWSGWPGFTCYRCGGAAYDPTHRAYGFPPAWTDEQIDQWWETREAKAAARAEAKRAKQQAEFEARYGTLLDTYPILATYEACKIACHEHDTCHEGVNYADLPAFAVSIHNDGIRQGFLSERQADALAKAWQVQLDRLAKQAAQAEADATATPCPTGRQTIRGRVLTTKWIENTFGYQRTSTLKMLVRDDRGFKVWTTCPSKIAVERGDLVQFDCEVNPSDDDPLFGFGKRPTKASVLEHADPDSAVGS